MISKSIFRAFALVLCCVVAGCQTTGQVWNSVIGKDEFTDKVTKMVTIGEFASSDVIWTKSRRLYPFVGIQDGEIYVGIRSGGRYRLPAGTVQIRIDNNESWTISPEETPIYLAPQVPALVPQSPGSPQRPESAVLDTASKMQAQMNANITKIMSPYTAVTGDKARAILKQMVKGKIIKYRQVGYNQASSTIGEVRIDESFLAALREIGIDPSSI